MPKPTPTLPDVRRLLAGARRALAAGLVLSAFPVAVLHCGSGLPRPRHQPAETGDYQVVPKPPPVTRVEIVPPAPSDDAVWVDGYHRWAGRHWIWQAGGWVEPPEGATRSPWAIRYRRDGQVLFWPPRWRDATGAPLTPPRTLRAAVGEEVGGR